jgi:hypothetical protein
MLIWDNASVQHRASGDFRVGESRRFWRHMIEGQQPLPFGRMTADQEAAFPEPSQEFLLTR